MSPYNTCEMCGWDRHLKQVRLSPATWTEPADHGYVCAYCRALKQREVECELESRRKHAVARGR